MPPTALEPELRLADGSRERAVAWSVDGETLRGNLLLGAPDAPLGVLFLHGWGGVRSGPHGLITELARRLGEAGVPSLRFDFRGRGESDRAYDAATLDTMGDDALAAAALLREQTGVQRLVLVGICSGGNVAIGVLDRLPDAVGIYGLSVYPFGDGDSFGRDAKRSARHLRDYWRKLWLPSTWRRLVRGAIDLRGVAGVLLAPFRARPAQQADAATSEKRRKPLDNLLETRARVTILYGDADPDFQASHDYYESFATQRDRPLQLEVIPGANHNFYAIAWTTDITRRLLRFTEELSHE